MKIRQIDADERPELSLPVQVYGFQPSPASGTELSRLRDNQRYFRDDITPIAEADGATIAAGRPQVSVRCLGQAGGATGSQ